MRSVARVIVVAVALGLPLGGCGTMTPDFDPMDWLAGDWFGTKKPLPGDRRQVFPEGVPGVARGVPSELMKDGQRAEEQQAAAPALEAAIREVEPKPKPKARPKPKPKAVATSEPEQSAPRASAPPRQPAQQQQQQQQQQVQWPEPAPARPQPQPQIQWPDPPPPR